MKNWNALIALGIMVFFVGFCLELHPLVKEVQGLLVGLVIIMLTSSGPLAYESPKACVWVRRMMLVLTTPVGAYMAYSCMAAHTDYWLAVGVALNPLWLLVTRELDKGQLAMGGGRKAALVRAVGDAWHPVWCATQLAYDVLQAHKAVEGYRMLGTELGHSGVPARVAAMHWLIKETEHTAGHHASMIKRLCCSYGADGLDLKVWQDGATEVGDYSGSPRSLQVHYEPGGDWATKRSGRMRREDLVITGAQREQIDLLHWVSRGEG